MLNRQELEDLGFKYEDRPGGHFKATWGPCGLDDYPIVYSTRDSFGGEVEHFSIFGLSLDVPNDAEVKYLVRELDHLCRTYYDEAMQSRANGLGVNYDATY